MRVDHKNYIMSNAACKVGDWIYVSSMFSNAMYKYNTLNGVTEFIGYFPDEEKNVWRMHGKAQLVGNKIYFLPDRSSYVHIFDFQENNVYSVDLQEEDRCTIENSLLVDNHIYFLIRNSMPKIGVLNTINNVVEKIMLPVEALELKYASDFILVNYVIYFVSKTRNVIMEFDIKTRKFQLNNVIFSEKKGFGTIAYGRGVFYVSAENSILIWDRKNKAKQILKLPHEFGIKIKKDDRVLQLKGFEDVFNNYQKPFTFSVACNDKILIFPMLANMIIEIDLNDNSLLQYRIIDEQENEETLLEYERITHCHYIFHEQEDTVLLSSTMTKTMYEINSKDYNIVSRYNPYDNYGVKRYIESIYPDGIYHESNEFALYDFIID